MNSHLCYLHRYRCGSSLRLVAAINHNHKIVMNFIWVVARKGRQEGQQCICSKQTQDGSDPRMLYYDYLCGLQENIGRDLKTLQENASYI